MSVKYTSKELSYMIMRESKKQDDFWIRIALEVIANEYKKQKNLNDFNTAR